MDGHRDQEEGVVGSWIESEVGETGEDDMDLYFAAGAVQDCGSVLVSARHLGLHS